MIQANQGNHAKMTAITQDMIDAIILESEAGREISLSNKASSPREINDSDFDKYLKETDKNPREKLTRSYITSRELVKNREKIKSFNDSKYKSSPESLDNYRVVYETSSGGFQARELPESRLNDMLKELEEKHTFPSESGIGTKTKSFNLGIIPPLFADVSPDEEVGFIIELSNKNKIFEMRRIMQDGKIHYLDNRNIGRISVPKIRDFVYGGRKYARAIAIRGKAEDFGKMLFSLCNVKSIHKITKKKIVYN